MTRPNLIKMQNKVKDDWWFGGGGGVEGVKRQHPCPSSSGVSSGRIQALSPPKCIYKKNKKNISKQIKTLANKNSAPIEISWPCTHQAQHECYLGWFGLIRPSSVTKSEPETNEDGSYSFQTRRSKTDPNLC